MQWNVTKESFKTLEAFGGFSPYLYPLANLKNNKLCPCENKSNMLAYRLVNEGVISKNRDTRHAWEILPSGKLFEDCLYQATKDSDRWNERMD